jgi:hypothetical protein
MREISLLFDTCAILFLSLSTRIILIISFMILFQTKRKK